MSADRGKARKGRAGRFFVLTLLVAAAAGASSQPTPRRLAKKAVDHGRAWSQRQLNRSLQAPVIKSQGERWRAMHPDS
ncbi:MAG TPA: hypothetical protein VK662_12600 [Acidothermaceae bacterium]|jgi:hypothetical protein|nr:hypothetical protein [Acidothermaceae bacterium]